MFNQIETKTLQKLFQDEQEFQIMSDSATPILNHFRLKIGESFNINN